MVSKTVQMIYEALIADGAITPDPAQRRVLPLLEEIRAHFANPPPPGGFLANFFNKPPEPPKGAYIWGGVGRGKSFLMDLFYDAVPIEAKRRVHFHAFMQEIHSGMAEARKTGVDDALKPVADRVASEVDLLCFDEMQISDITDAMIVGRLFEALFEARVVVVTTSNRVPDDLYKDGLNRQLFLPFIALIKDRMVVHELVSDTDYRQHQLEGSESYFTPVNEASRAEVEAIWQELSGGRSDRLFLTVQGREVELARFMNGVARVPFWELCGRPLGAADYLAVADAVKVLILEDVPHLSQYNYNEAKRFVTLIDTLYESKTRLIVTAADTPERLYLEGAGNFEFERTASRLREMQSEGWGT
ncbi:ATPase, AFG1 family [Candidatus Rhodobacter oscarellae]|uniref:ATPase, AFG1 family n=1 Tax=Candidatus Rhodobacter oscarellae TaxID=1675527 RepID=A0A0J9GZP1_9RHOB|nr:cell division protein ZapE [Candidatus Rhodobacter lobularis]KMW58948.1 ATPase, AFG1 family [Candidatus Rhodobacter lobularis]